MTRYLISIWNGPKLLDQFEQTMDPDHVKRRRDELIKRYGTTDVAISDPVGELYANVVKGWIAIVHEELCMIADAANGHYRPVYDHDRWYAAEVRPRDPGAKCAPSSDLPQRCPKCGAQSGDDWSQCGGSCPMPMSPYYKKGCDMSLLSIPDMVF